MFLTIYSTRGAPTVSSYSQNNNSVDLPIVDYDAEITKEKSKTRKEKDERFKGHGNSDKRPIAELPNGVEPLPTNAHWWLGLSAVPMDQSDVVILGNIVARDTHLSDDRTGIYSEFTVQVNEVFRDSTSAVVAGSPLFVNRPGGSVRFASGKIQRYRLSGQGFPRAGSQYV